ncbi:hypothetical protein KP003_16770 [Geomonas nitrogeniifigens]|uniref:hypothetical protein n=1 Tax=Geomonas diazotrophica TaxID=2843197 RepID=UPI001C2CB358|nr:hypothetical protein [Geomonas nitrogeniifigens]QXE85995.1 hypothetical protein KP003_16770 [Geomonas nitrogeniifigens]
MTTQTILIRCLNPDCSDLAPQDSGYCAKCREKKPHKCATVGCDTIVYGLNVYCAECKHERGLECQRGSKERITKAYPQIEVAKPKKRQPVKIVKTAAQVERENQAEWRRLLKVREGLNQDLLAERMMRRAICSY